MSYSTDETKPNTPGDNHVGYGSPPRHQQFKKSGNPNGRPADVKNRKTIVKQVA